MIPFFRNIDYHLLIKNPAVVFEILLWLFSSITLKISMISQKSEKPGNGCGLVPPIDHKPHPLPGFSDFYEITQFFKVILLEGQSNISKTTAGILISK